MFSFLVAVANSLQACELPAHPNAAAVPVEITLKGETKEQKIADCSAVKLIQGKNDGTFYYLIPEGSKVKLRIVWDPLCHNNPSKPGEKDFEYKKEQYEYVSDAKMKLDMDEDIGKIGGFGFFPLEAMSEYFTLNGNRKDAKEAFSREYGSIDQTEVILDKNMGPEFCLSTSFASMGASDFGFSIVGSKNSSHKDEPVIPPTKETDKDGLDDVNKFLPGFHSNFKDKENDILILEGNKLKLVSKASGSPTWGFAKIEGETDIVRYLENRSGIDMTNIKFGLKQPEPKNFKAYISEEDNSKKIHITGIGYDKNAEDAACGGNSDSSFYVTFTTPSIAGDKSGSDEDKALLKIKVDSPPAGYNLTDLYWVWEEQTYKQVTSGKYELAEDSELPTNENNYKKIETNKSNSEESSEEGNEEADEEGDEENNEENTESSTKYEIDVATAEKLLVYEKKGASRKCSCGLSIVLCKRSDSVGYAGYKIYDNFGPVISKLIIEDNKDAKYFERDGSEEIKSTFDFEIRAIDSNPYFAKTIVADSGEKITDANNVKRDISQNKENMDLTFYYNYPVYEFYKEDIKSMENLRGVGLVDLSDDNKSGSDVSFKGLKHKTKWLWKKVKGENVVIKSIEHVKSLKADDGSAIGSEVSIKGKFTIDNPKPWHESGTKEDKKFSCFAVFKDTAKNTHLVDGIFKDGNEENASANPANNSDKEYVINPLSKNISELGANISDDKKKPVLADELIKQASFDSEFWQRVNKLEVIDETGPEIQVIVFDTRTNRYHVFGTSENSDAGYNGIQSTKKGFEDKGYSGVDFSKIPYINKNSAISKSYIYDKLDDVNGLFNRYYQGPDAVTTVFDNANKNGFVCGKNTRLVFYIHAFDNIGYMDMNQGVISCKATLSDKEGRFETKSVDLKNESFFDFVFRQENVDSTNKVVTPYILKVEATDSSDKNTREFYLNIGVVGRTLDIRTLEEKRERVN